MHLVILSVVGVGTGSMGIVNAGLGYSPASGTEFMLVLLLKHNCWWWFNDCWCCYWWWYIISKNYYFWNWFQQGDVLGITSIGGQFVGRNGRLSIVSIGRTDEIIIDNVQGDFAVGGKLTYTHPITGLTTSLNTTVGSSSTNAKLLQ